MYFPTCSKYLVVKAGNVGSCRNHNNPIIIMSHHLNSNHHHFVMDNSCWIMGCVRIWCNTLTSYQGNYCLNIGRMIVFRQYLLRRKISTRCNGIKTSLVNKIDGWIIVTVGTCTPYYRMWGQGFLWQWPSRVSEGRFRLLRNPWSQNNYILINGHLGATVLFPAL